MEGDAERTNSPADGSANVWAPQLPGDNDYTTVMLLAAGLARIRSNRRRTDAGEYPGHSSAEHGLLPAPWRSGMVRLWWRFQRAGEQPPASDLDLIDLCRTPFGQWPVQLKLSTVDQDMSLLDGDDLSSLAEEAVGLTIADVEAELVEHQIYGELMMAAETNGSDADGVQTNYVYLRRFLIDHPVISDREVRRLVQRFPASGTNGQPFVHRFLNAAYVRRPAQGAVTIPLCDRCGNPLDDIDAACATAGCTVKPITNTIQVTGAYHVQHRAARRFFHDPGLVEARVIDAVAAQAPKGSVRVEAWPGLDAYDIRLSFAGPGSPASGQAGEVWGADAKDQVSPGLLAMGFRWKPEPVCDRRFLVLPMHRAQQPGYIEDLTAELDGRVTGVAVMDEHRFVSNVVDRANQVAGR